MRFQRLSERVEGPAAVVQVEGRSTVEDWRPRNSYHRGCYVFASWAASTCHWNWTATNVRQKATVGSTREPLQQATDVRAQRSWTQRADGLSASAAAVTLVSMLMVRWQRKPCHWSLTGPQHNEVVIEVMSPLKSAPSCRGFWTHILHKIPFTHTSLSPKWHVDHFIRFCRTHSCVTHTQRLGTTVTTNCILCVKWQCWLRTVSCQILCSMWLFWVKCHLTVQRMMRCWCGYLSEARCRSFAYGLADATAS